MSSPLDDPPAQQRLGDFEIVRELGRGGMGVVYEARQVSLNRQVALKVLSGSLGLSPKAVPRFRREAEAAAKLHHTNIVPVYATGEENGTHFYAMELIDGPSLDAVIRQLRQAQNGKVPGELPGLTPPGSPPDATGPYVEGANPPASGVAAALTSSSLSSDGHYFDTVAKMIADVADALDYAHNEGVIHRDIKPSNLLLSPDGRLSINDFGLARMLEEPGMTVTGEFVGTPAYMSPEQITAGRVPINHRTDIYSLGATLYELLTLRPPFTGKGLDQMLAQVLHKDPKPPRRVNRKVPLDLETICLKAMDKDPDRRYQTAGELAADLRRYVNRFAIAARRAGPVERLRKWVKRHPALAAALALAVVAAAAAGYFGYRAHVAEAERLAAQQRYEDELQAERRQRALDDAIAAAMSGDPGRADKAIKDAERVGVPPGQVRLLSGLVHYQRGEADPARTELEQAAALMPESVAARALLALIFSNPFIDHAKPGALKHSTNASNAMAEMYRLTPTTPEDFLFRGYVNALFDPVAALGDLDEAVRRRDSPIARAFRGFARASAAMHRGDLPTAERALADIRAAKAWLPDNRFVRGDSGQAHLIAAILYGEAGREDERRAALEEAKSDARALENAARGAGLFAHALYFEQIGDEAAALAVYRQLAEKAEKGGRKGAGPGFLFALALYGQGKIREALEALDRTKEPHPWADMLRTFVLAEHPEHGPDRAYEYYRELAHRYRREEGTPRAGEGLYGIPLELWNLHGVLLLLGKRQEAAAACADVRAPAGFFRPGAQKHIEAMKDFVAGKLSEDELLRSSRGNRIQLCLNHYWIGLVRLADGDRRGAREHFRKAVATGVFMHGSYYYSRAFLNRLDQDPAWPRWLPVKE
jgi:serine/threonine protein kinase